MIEIEKIRRQIGICIMLVCMLFLISIAMGYGMALQSSVAVKKIVGQSLSQFSGIRSLSSLMIFLFIFLSNSIKGFFVIVSGAMFGISSLMFIFFNGQLIGFVLGLAQTDGIGTARIIISIAPHGILEIPAIILSASYGLWLGYRFYRFIWLRDEFKIYFSYALKRYFQLILPLFFVAALIEAFITPYVISFLK